jgi:hypothetical protein
VREWRTLATDVGVVQPHELRVDRDSTRAALEAWQSRFDAMVQTEARRLGDAAAVLGDVPPLAFAAAAEAGVPSYALANFSWDWIYERMGFTHAAANAARAYAHAQTLLRLTPAAPMPAFGSVVDVGVLARPPLPQRAPIRAALRVAESERLVLIAFRAPDVCRLPPPARAVRYVRLDGGACDRADVAPSAGFSFTELLAAADVVVAKAGYGIVSDCATTGRALLYVLRSGFPEDEMLGAWLSERSWAREVHVHELAAGRWVDALEEAFERRPLAPPPDYTGMDAAIEVLLRALG